MAIKITNTRQAVKVQASQRSKQTMGKKVLELGKEYTILFPKKDGEVVVAGIVGRNCSYDDLGMSFGRIADTQMEINEETGRIKDNSGMQEWAVISSLLYEASKLLDIEKAKEEAQKVADATGDVVDSLALNQTITKITEEYEGRAKTATEKAVMPTKQRLVSSRIDFSIFTEAVLIPLDKSMLPEYEKAVGVEVRLSATKQRQLNDIIDNPNYNDQDDKDGFLEVKFSYTGASTQEAGRNPYSGVEKNIRKVDLTKKDGKYVDTGVQSIAYILNDTTNDHDLMFSRAGAVSYAQTAVDVEGAMKKFLANNRMLPVHIDAESDMFKRNAKMLYKMGVLYKEGSPQYKQLKDLVESQEAEEAESNPIDELEETMTGSVQELTKAKSTKEVADIVDSDDELKDMLGDDEIADI